MARPRAVVLLSCGLDSTTTAAVARADGFDVYSNENPRMRCETTSILFDWTYDGAINRVTQNDDTIVPSETMQQAKKKNRGDTRSRPSSMTPKKLASSMKAVNDS